MKRNYIGPVLVLLLANACQVTKPYQRPEPVLQALYRDRQTATDTATVATMARLDFFTDSLLADLITEGLDNNLDLKIAVRNIAKAKAAFEQSRGAFLPDLRANLSVKQSKLAFPQGFGIINTSTQYDVGVTSGWEADIWGRLRSAKRGALAALLRSEEVKKAVETRLVADIAGYYYTLLALDEQLKILEKTLENRIADVRTVKALLASNVVNGAAVVQSEANQYAAEAALPVIKRQIRETENALSLLLARPSGAIIRSSPAARQPLPELRTGLPSQLLQNRPDVKQAEYEFREAFENTNVARTMFYPALQLTAAGGFTSFDFKNWLSSLGLFGNVAAGLVQPVLAKGANKARLATAQALQEQAAFGFQKALLRAGQEVSDALFAYEAALEQQEVRAKQLGALTKAVDFNKKLLRYSSATNYTDVLTAEQQLLTAQMDDVNDRLQQWKAVISLYCALGGGTH